MHTKNSTVYSTCLPILTLALGVPSSNITLHHIWFWVWLWMHFFQKWKQKKDILVSTISTGSATWDNMCSARHARVTQLGPSNSKCFLPSRWNDFNSKHLPWYDHIHIHKSVWYGALNFSKVFITPAPLWNWILLNLQILSISIHPPRPEKIPHSWNWLLKNFLVNQQCKQITSKTRSERNEAKKERTANAIAVN